MCGIRDLRKLAITGTKATLGRELNLFSLNWSSLGVGRSPCGFKDEETDAGVTALARARMLTLK